MKPELVVYILFPDHSIRFRQLRIIQTTRGGEYPWTSPYCLFWWRRKWVEMHEPAVSISGFYCLLFWSNAFLWPQFWCSFTVPYSLQWRLLSSSSVSPPCSTTIFLSKSFGLRRLKIFGDCICPPSHLLWTATLHSWKAYLRWWRGWCRPSTGTRCVSCSAISATKIVIDTNSGRGVLRRRQSVAGRVLCHKGGILQWRVAVRLVVPAQPAHLFALILVWGRFTNLVISTSAPCTVLLIFAIAFHWAVRMTLLNTANLCAHR